MLKSGMILSVESRAGGDLKTWPRLVSGPNAPSPSDLCPELDCLPEARHPDEKCSDNDMDTMGFYGDFMGISGYPIIIVIQYLIQWVFMGISDHSSNLIVGIYKNGTK